MGVRIHFLGGGNLNKIAVLFERKEGRTGVEWAIKISAVPWNRHE